MPSLSALLHETFGHKAFRANQEAVCRAATDGQDVLLVMPTGAGKSLCYQLPALARGGTGLVISPLIALMDDQASKLTAAGLRVARIHSGLSRDAARQACRDYLDGHLQFLFIAPERMRVPGFPEMLAKRKPSLIAIDEAHCISAWGHDFRPDYRTLGDYLPQLRPAPIIALTATATPTVQKDIVAQLSLSQPALFIHGFRRDNLHIEVLELSKPRRTEFVTTFLADKSRRPAIVYAPSRKTAEELAGDLNRALGRGSAAAYHAGLDPTTREQVQHQFLSGKLQVVVATIAFGMGIDKADVRTVVHFALPASVEAYYQEIGRAGRDGDPSRTVLLYSYADRKMHDFFLERDYPVAAELTKVARLLQDEYQSPELLRQKLKMDADTFARSVEKLASQGAAVTDFDSNVRRGATTTWQSGYEQQVNFRRGQIDRMMDFAQTQQCRMTALIRHFGDTADATKPCGHCDFCAPSAVTSQVLVQPSETQQRQLRQILLTLHHSGKSTGQIHIALNLPDRKQTDDLLDGLARAGLLTMVTETFTKPDGQTISYKKAALTHEGQTLGDSAPLGVLLRAVGEDAAAKSSSGGKSRKRAAVTDGPAYTPAQQSLEANLRAFRKAKAAETGKPAFIVFGDSALAALVLAQPQTIPQLLQVSGFGPDKAEKYGADIVALCRGGGVPEASLSSTSASRPRRVSSKLTSPAPASFFDVADPVPDYDASPPPDDDFPAYDPETAGLGAYDEDAAAALHEDRVSLAERYTLAPVPLEAAKPAVKPSAPKPVRIGPSQIAPRAVVDPTSLTPAQQAVEHRLRTWRKTESERLGLPQFFVLGTTTLRSIVVQQPSTLAQLSAIDGIGADKLEKYGAAILEACQQS